VRGGVTAIADTRLQRVPRVVVTGGEYVEILEGLRAFDALVTFQSLDEVVQSLGALLRVMDAKQVTVNTERRERPLRPKRQAVVLGEPACHALQFGFVGGECDGNQYLLRPRRGAFSDFAGRLTPGDEKGRERGNEGAQEGGQGCSFRTRAISISGAWFKRAAVSCNDASPASPRDKTSV